MRHPHYWKAYHASKLYDKLEIFKICSRVVSILGPPWQVSKRGRLPKFRPELYAAMGIFRKYFGSSLRAAEGETPLLIGLRMDHATIWWGLQRMPIVYFERALELLYELIAKLFKCEIFITDSTGVETDRYQERRRALKTCPEREFVKLHVLEGYSREAGLVPIVAARVTQGQAHDSPQFKCLLKKFRGGGEPLLGDSAYDAAKNFELAKRHGFEPVIKLKNIGLKGLLRRQAARDFDRNRELYRMRGVGEAPFGGFAVRYESRTRCRLLKTRAIDSLLMAIAHNLRTYARARAMKRMKIFICRFIRQPRRFGVCRINLTNKKITYLLHRSVARPNKQIMRCGHK